MPRYKVMAKNDRQLRKVEALVEGRTHVYGTSEMFQFVATDDLSPELQAQLRRLGARVVPEEYYEPESPG